MSAARRSGGAGRRTDQRATRSAGHSAQGREAGAGTRTRRRQRQLSDGRGQRGGRRGEGGGSGWSRRRTGRTRGGREGEEPAPHVTGEEPPPPSPARPPPSSLLPQFLRLAGSAPERRGRGGREERRREETGRRGHGREGRGSAKRAARHMRLGGLTLSSHDAVRRAPIGALGSRAQPSPGAGRLGVSVPESTC